MENINFTKASLEDLQAIQKMITEEINRRNDVRFRELRDRLIEAYNELYKNYPFVSYDVITEDVYSETTHNLFDLVGEMRKESFYR